jgi:hypothetical protein
MSLASSPDSLFRPEDKAFKTLFLSVEDSINTFDEYLNGEIYDHSDQDSNKGLSEALVDFLDRKQSISSRSEYVPIVAAARTEQASPQPWREGLWCMNQNLTAAPDITIAKTRNNTQHRRTSQKRTYDGTRKGAYLNPRSPPTTLSSKEATGTKSFATSPRTVYFTRSPYARQGPLSREVTLSPSPMYSQLQNKGRMAQQDSLQQDLQNFHLRRSEIDVLSPPSSGNRPQPQVNAMQLNAAIAAQNNAAVLQHGYQTMYAVNPQSQRVGNGYASVDPSLLSPSQIGQAVSSHGDEAVYASQYESHSSHGLPTWTTESLESSDESHYSYESLRSLENAQLIREGHAWQSQEEAPWQSPALSANYMDVRQQYPQQYYYPILAQPTPHRPTHQLIQQPPPVHTEGLGIHFPLSAALSPQTQNYPTTNPMQAYPPLPPPPTYAFTNEDPFSTPRRTRRQSSPLRSPSPCVSPTNTSRTLRQRSPTHHASPTRNRRKSIGNAGPISHTAVPPMPKTPKTPRTPTGHGVIDFVNFTPKDHAKLLSDVAPSGSSKTRARREAEARDKRRRLNEAALKAVERAGGDLRALKAEGLCLS